MANVCQKNRPHDTGLDGFLRGYPRGMVSLGQLEQAAAGCAEYGQFAAVVQAWADAGILTPVAASGTNQAKPPLALKYRVNKAKLYAGQHEDIRQRQVAVHSVIQLDGYFKHDAALWQQDKPWIDRLNAYLIKNGLPEHSASVWERSYEIAGDEKWISEGGGYAFLQRVAVYDKLKIVDIAEPLMFALNPARIGDQTCLHLVVENKTTYSILAEVLPQTDFLTIIYGAGKDCISGIGQLERQLHLADRVHKLFYFGDLDFEGISIWHMVNNRRPAQPATVFYQALLAKPFTLGKQNQRQEAAACHDFLSYFAPAEQDKLRGLLACAGYYPQEALSAAQLTEIVRQTPWKSI